MPGLVRLLSLAGRLAFAITLALLALAASRWSPIDAQPPLDVRALPLAGPAVGFAVLAALTGRERRGGPWRRRLWALVATVGALAAVVVLRGPSGLPTTVSSPAGPIGTAEAGAIDVTGRELRGLPVGRRVLLQWTGELRVPASGRYELWVEGRGHATVALDGHPVLEGDGDPLRAAATLGLARGAARLDVRLEHAGPGPRLRLGWTRPDGRREVVPPRYLGPPRPAWWWWLTDALALVIALLSGLLAWTAPWDAPRRLPETRPVTVGEIAVSTAGYLLLLAVMSWPLARDLAHTGPMDRPDGRLNTWILAYVGETVWSAPSRLFQAPNFHPLPDALAFSENLLLPAAVVAPLQKLGGPVFAYNAALLGSLLLSGLGAQLLVRRVGGDRLAAFVAGACFAAGPQRWTRLSHLHAQVTVFLPLALLALDRFWERRTLRRALAVGLLLALQGLASIYLGAITATALAVAVAVALLGGLKPRELARLAAGFLLAGGVLWPVMRPYLRMRAFEGQEFTLETVSTYAASLPSYAAAGTGAWGWLTQRLLDPADVRDTLFPGLVLLALGVAGLAAAPRRYRAVAVAASLVAVVFSLGPETALLPLPPRARRAGARRARPRTLRPRPDAGALGPRGPHPVGTTADRGPRRARADHGRVGEPPPAPRALRRTLAGVAVARREGRGGPRPAPRRERHPRHARQPRARPPPRERRLRFHPAPLRPGDGALRERGRRGGPSLLAGRGRAARGRAGRGGAGAPARALALVGLTPVAEPGGERVLEVTPGPAAAVVAPAEASATRFTPAGTVIVLPEPRTIGRVAFELSDAPWLPRPRVEASRDGTTWEPVEATASLADATLSLYRDPRHGAGEVRFPPREVRFLRLDVRLPARPGPFGVGG